MSVTAKMQRLLMEAEKPTDMKKVVGRLVKQAQKVIDAYFEAQGFAERVKTSFEHSPARGGYGPYEMGTVTVYADSTMELRVTGDVTDGTVSISAKSGYNTLESFHSTGPAATAAKRVKAAAERFATLNAGSLKRSNAQQQQSQQLATKGKAEQTAEFVASLLRGMNTKTGGTLKVVSVEPESIDIDPARRQRLDHYGNDGDGWDDEGWEYAYAGPLRKEIEATLKGAGITKWYVDVGEKGHVYLMRSGK